LKDCRDNYYYFSGKASDLARQLGYVGMALIWIFRVENNGKVNIQESLVLSALFIVLALVCDFLHYLCGALIWGIYNRRQEKRGVSQDTEFTAPPSFNWPTLCFFWAKMVFIVIAYGIIFKFLILKFFH